MRRLGALTLALVAAAVGGCTAERVDEAPAGTQASTEGDLLESEETATEQDSGSDSGGDVGSEAACDALPPEAVSALLGYDATGQGYSLDTREASQTVGYFCYFKEGVYTVLAVDVISAVTDEAAALIDQLGLTITERVSYDQPVDGVEVAMGDEHSISGNQKVQLHTTLSGARSLVVTFDGDPARAEAAYAWFQANAADVAAWGDATDTIP